MYFASDNTSGVAPQVLAALTTANQGYAPSYGNDEIMPRVTTLIRQIFEAPEAIVHLVATGTAANALALASCTPPWGSVFCHTHAHIAEDECGAPEFYTNGAKLVLVAGEHGVIHGPALDAALAKARAGNLHRVQPSMLSLSNVTEAGTTLTPAQTAELAQKAKSHHLPVHLDGARFANAVVATGASPADLTWRAGVDILSFGGTKNGCMGVEALVIFDPASLPARGFELELRRKRAGHLFSKHRYLSAQFEAYLTNGLWLDLAARANKMAARLADGLRQKPGITLLHPTPANMIFAHLPAASAQVLRDAGAAFHADPIADGQESARFVTSWSTTEAEVDGFLAQL